VNVHRHDLMEKGYGSLSQWLAASSDHVYVGRQNCWVDGAKASKWKNPFSAKKLGIQEALTRYEDHLVRSGLVADIEELRGKTLGCWCDPSPCHGHVLVKYLDEHPRTKILDAEGRVCLKRRSWPGSEPPRHLTV
jgi:Domain of unknown function (DUF4326)